MTVTDTTLSGMCEGRMLGKMDERNIYQQGGMRHTTVRNLACRLNWTNKPRSQVGPCKILTVNDECSEVGFTFYLQHKGETVKALIDLDKTIENKFQKRVHILRSDNGSEFLNNEFQRLVKIRGPRS